jgi:hypothetical protein
VAYFRPGSGFLGRRDGRAERFQLLSDRRVPRYVSAGEMGPDADDPYPARRLRGQGCLHEA